MGQKLKDEFKNIMRIIQTVKQFIRNLHPDKRWRKTAPQKIFESPSLSQTIKKKYVPLWFNAFLDSQNGGFYEQLDMYLKPVPLNKKRLLSQCRQIYLYTEADDAQKTLLKKLEAPYQFLKKNYARGRGQWVFATDDKGAPIDTHFDFYGHAFLILALTRYGKEAQNLEALQDARSTLEFLKNSFAHKNGLGFYEALDENLNPIIRTRRQNPHMHLFEACLFAFEASKDEIYAQTAHEIFELFQKYFYNEETKTLHEYFEEDFTKHKTEGHRIEAGHHFEWVWLLDFYSKLFPIRALKVKPYQEALYNWACVHGYDSEFGGIFDEQNPNGEIILNTKRIWPLCEAMRAHRVMRGRDERAVKLLEATKTLLNTRYLKANGAWVERFSRDFREIKTDILPATSVYHL